MEGSSVNDNGAWEANESLAIKLDSTTEDGASFSFRPSGRDQWTSLEVQLRVRAVEEFRKFSKETSALNTKLAQANMSHNMKKMKNMNSGANNAETDIEFQRNVREPLLIQLREISETYAKNLKIIFGLEQLSGIPLNGWMIHTVSSGKYEPINGAEDIVSLNLVSRDVTTCKISGLASNTKYELSVVTREPGAKEWSQPCPGISFWTKAAEWQILLNRNGLSNLIPILLEKGYSSVASWSKLGTNEKLEELGLDASAASLFKEVMSHAGIVSAEEKIRLQKEQESLKAFIDEMEGALKNENDFAVGSPITYKKRFGVVTQNSKTGIYARFGTGVNAAVEEVKSKDLKPTSFDVFISHAQSEAQNQVGHLGALLQEFEVKAWIDMDAEKLEAKDMCRGIQKSNHFVIYLTRSYLDRYFCRMEAMMAQKLNKPLIIVFEPDSRHGGDADYVKLVNKATRRFPEFKDWLLSVEAIPMARRAYQRRALIEELISRMGLKNSVKGNKGPRKTQLKSTESKVIEALERKVNDLQAEIEDLHSDNKALWAAIEDLRMK